MELYQLEQFIGIVENSNMKQAAEKLFVSQPALSNTVKNLENEFNTEFFVREKGKSMVLNEAGYKFYLHAKKILQAVEALNEDFNGPRTNITVVSDGSFFYSKIISKYLEAEEWGIQNITAKQMGRDKILGEIYNKKADIAIHAVSGYEVFPENIEKKFILSIKFYLSVPDCEEYENLESVTFKDIEKIPLYISYETTPKEYLLNHLEKDRGYKFNIVGTLDKQTQIELGISSKSKYATLISSVNLGNHKNKIKNRKIIPISDDLATRNYYLIYYKSNKAAKEFADKFKRFFYENDK